MTSMRDRVLAEREKARKRYIKNLPKAFKKRLGARIHKLFTGSLYTPHQGPQECARRLRQIKSGFIQPF